MSIVFESVPFSTSLSSFRRWVQEDESENDLFLSKAALSSMDFVSKSSGFTRSMVKEYDVITGTKHSEHFSALGFTSAFNVIGGALSMRKGFSELRQRIGDATGRALAYLSCARGGLQLLGGLVFVTIRSLDVAQLFTENKMVKAVTTVFGFIASGVSQTRGVLTDVSYGIEIYEAYCVVELIVDRDPEESLRILQDKLRDPGERTSFIRATSEECAVAIEGANPAQAEEIISRIYEESSKAYLGSLLELTLVGLGIVASMLVTLSAAPSVLLAATGINTFLQVFGLISSLVKLVGAFKKEGAGRYDMLLLETLSAGCVLALGMTLFFQNQWMVWGVSMGLGLAWFLVTAAAFRKTVIDRAADREYI